MKTIYLDNAATTALRPKVIERMTEVLKDNFGNASSTHSFGRASKALLEQCRKNIASYFNVSSSEIVFTSGGTEICPAPIVFFTTALWSLFVTSRV